MGSGEEVEESASVVDEGIEDGERELVGGGGFERGKSNVNEGVSLEEQPPVFAANVDGGRQATIDLADGDLPGGGVATGAEEGPGGVDAKVTVGGKPCPASGGFDSLGPQIDFLGLFRGGDDHDARVGAGFEVDREDPASRGCEREVLTRGPGKRRGLPGESR